MNDLNIYQIESSKIDKVFHLTWESKIHGSSSWQPMPYYVRHDDKVVLVIAVMRPVYIDKVGLWRLQKI